MYLMKCNKKVATQVLILYAFSTTQYTVSVGLTQVVFYYEIASHTQISKNTFIFENLLLDHASLMYENTTIAFSVIHFSHFLQKTH